MKTAIKILLPLVLLLSYTNSYALSIQSYNGSSPYFLQPYHTGNAVVRWSAVDTLFFDVIITSLDLARIDTPGSTQSYMFAHWVTRNHSGEKWYSIWTSGPLAMRYAGIADAYVIRTNPLTRARSLSENRLLCYGNAGFGCFSRSSSLNSTTIRLERAKKTSQTSIPSRRAQFSDRLLNTLAKQRVISFGVPMC